MRVLQVNKLYSPWIGGVEKVVQDIAERLQGKVEMKVLVCQPKGAGTREIINKVEVFRAGSIGIYSSMPVSFSFPFLLKKLAKDADILHFHLPFPMATLSHLLVRPKAKVVVWWHSDIVRQKNMMRLYKPFLIQFLKRADRIIVATKEHIGSSAVLKSFEDKCSVIPFGIDASLFEFDENLRRDVARLREKYGSKIVLFVGRLIYYKGVEHLIRAMKDVDGTLLIVGQGPLESHLRRVATKCGLYERVVFLGKVQDREMTACYHSCDVFVLPSIARSEAFGLVQLEAMACGKPVVNTDLPTGVSFVSRHGETGLTVPPADSAAMGLAIKKLLEDADLREKYGLAARERVEKYFNVARMADDMYHVYEEVLR